MKTLTRILCIALTVITGATLLPRNVAAAPPQVWGGFPRGDINRDTYPDYVLFNPTTRQSAVWFMQRNMFLNAVYSATLPAGWEMATIGVRFNTSDNAGLVLVNLETRQTAVWFVNQSGAFVSGTYGPTLPAGWNVIAAVPVNDDLTTSPDYVLYNPSTRQTAIWFLDFPSRTGAAYGPTLPSGWTLVEAVDINNDTHPDFVLTNPSTRQTAVWFMNGASLVTSAYGPTLPSGWTLQGAADFNQDAMPDFVLQEAETRRTAIWYMNGVHYSSGALGPAVPSAYRLVSP